MTHTGGGIEPLGLDAPHCIPAEHIHVEQCCRAGAAEGRASVRSEAEVKAEALRGARDFFRATDQPIAADQCEELATQWDAAALRAAERAEGGRNHE